MTNKNQPKSENTKTPITATTKTSLRDRVVLFVPMAIGLVLMVLALCFLAHVYEALSILSRAT